jgi:Asp-tRNA(Asn)/Glu-tRNA(Gln) amidotransferase A subunit family amidase
MVSIYTSMTDGDLREYYEELCDRISAVDTTVQALVPGTFDRERIAAQVERCLELFPEQSTRPPLFAVPVGIKDIFHCDGFTTRCGSCLPPELFQGPEAESVSRLKSAGAVVMGKTATTEFAYYAPAATRNPVNLAHTPGGSSSGSAAGVAAGFFDVALGSQTVGSVIRPASYCGVVGFKPSLGRIGTDGVVPFSVSVDHVGVFCKTAAMLPATIAVLDPSWQPASTPGRLRLGIPAGPYLSQAEDQALTAFQAQTSRLARTGIEFVETPVLEDIDAVNDRHTKLISAEIARVHAPWFQNHQHLYRAKTRQIIVTGQAVAESELTRLRESCLELRQTLAEAMRRYRIDAFACPSTTGEAPEGLASTGSPLMNLPWTHAGLPSVSLPAGFGSGGLPLGLQLVGGFDADEALIGAAMMLAPLLVD